MAISMLDNIGYKGQKPDNSRSSFATIAEMASYPETYLANIYVTMVEETGKQYMYQRSNTVDLEHPELGKWRELSGGSADLTNYYNKVEVDDLVKVAKDIADENATHIGSMTSLAVDTWTDLVTAINALYNSFMSSITYANKKMTITYRNGNSIEIDVSPIITDTNIEEFKNVAIEDVEDGQALSYDSTTSKWTNKTIDLAKVLQDAKDYTDVEIVKAQESNSVACDEKPSYDSSTDTVTYKQNGETKTEDDTRSWFYYIDDEGFAIQTRWINGIEFTIDVGAIDLSDYVNKTTDITGVFEENPTDLTKIPNLQYMQTLRLVLITALGKKINTTDIVNTLNSEATDKPLSANQGKVLDGKITELAETVDGKLDMQQDESHAGKVVSVGEDGKLIFTDGGGAAENVSYENASHTNWDTVKKALDGIIAKVEYVKPEITSFTKSVGDVFEIGQKVSSIDFAWTLNKEVTSQTLTDCTVTVDDRTATYNTELSANKTFTLSVSDGENSASKSLSIAFRNKIYFGGATEPSDYDSAFILGLAKNQFATTCKGSYSVSCGNNEYGYIAYPKSFTKISTVWIGGFEYEVVPCADISFTNASGYASTYSIVRTSKPSLGSIVMEVK
ncbi:MAG: hypothetical protein KBT35_07910 [Firmicutes bacterium]|nr:hypothetical protein [Candidatus Colivicinus equi]